jgi:hypothetical protein
LEKIYNLSKEIEGQNREIALLEERISALEAKKSRKKTNKKADNKVKPKQELENSVTKTNSVKIYFQRKSKKSLENFIAQKTKEGYLLLTKKEKNGMWKAEMEKAK